MEPRSTVGSHTTAGTRRCECNTYYEAQTTTRAPAD